MKRDNYLLYFVTHCLVVYHFRRFFGAGPDFMTPQLQKEILLVFKLLRQRGIPGKVERFGALCQGFVIIFFEFG